MKATIPTFFCTSILAMSGLKSCSVDPVHPYLVDGEYATRYILILGDGGKNRVRLAGTRKDFENALPKGDTAWHTEILSTLPDGNISPLSPNSTPAKTNITYFTSVQIAHVVGTPQGGTPPDQPCTQHVTQKIGADNLAQIKKVLDQLEQ